MFQPLATQDEKCHVGTGLCVELEGGPSIPGAGRRSRRNAWLRKRPFPRARALVSLKGVITLGILFERREQIRHLAERYRTGNVRVFGSVARGENTGASDVDLLVTPRAGCSLFDLGGLLEDLQELLGCRVDLVTEDARRPVCGSAFCERRCRYEATPRAPGRHP